MISRNFSPKLESLPPEKEVTLLVEVVEKPPPAETKLLENVVVQILPNSNESRQNASKSEVTRNGKDFKFKKPKVICEASHSPPSTPQIPGSASVTKTIDKVVKDEVPEVEANEEEFEEYEEEEEEECLRIIEETLVDVRTLPGRTIFTSYSATKFYVKLKNRKLTLILG